MVSHKVSLILLFLFSFTVTTFSYAGAAERWEYEPVMKDMNIHVKGYKVDQYGNAVNDYEYNTKIDPKTLENRKKAGSVGFGRLLKTTGWGLLGSAALEALLNSVDWILDPEAQSIWRYKRPTGGDYSCHYVSKIHDGTTQIKQFYSNDDKSFCPYDIALKRLEYRLKTTYANMPYVKELKFVEWNPVLTPDTTSFRFKFSIHRSDTSNVSYEYLDVPYKSVPYTAPTEKEYLKPEELADYANKTHPDYAKPELAEKLNPKYSPNIASDLWKPSNPWEEVNSPTVQEVQKKLDQAQPEPKKDPEIKPNPETGGSVLPKFCDWAAPVCEFIKDVKEFIKNEEQLDNDVEIQEKPLEQKTVDLNFGSACPAPVVLIDSTFYGQPFKIEYSFNDFCSILSDFVRPVLIAMGAFIAALILGGVKTNE